MKKRRRGSRRRSKRAPVYSSDNVGPTPETLAKLKPWPIVLMLRDERLSVDQFESAVKVAEAFRLITGAVGFKPLDLERVGIGKGDLGGRAERLIAQYVRWGNEFKRRFKLPPHVVVEWIEDERPIYAGSVPMLCHALNLWQKTGDDMAREAAAERRRVDKPTDPALYSARVLGRCD